MTADRPVANVGERTHRPRLSTQPRRSRVLPFLIIFFGGWNFALPVAGFEEIPVWLTAFTPVPRVFLHELLLLAYLVTRLAATSLRQFRPTGPARRIASLMLVLVVLGTCSNLVNRQPVRELGEAARLLLLTVYFAVLVRWSTWYGPRFVLRPLLMGLVAGGLVNVYYSFQIRIGELAGLPFLLGQNGPGGFLAMMVVLGAWFMRIASNGRDRLVALCSLAVALFTTTISFSKLAILMAMAGIVGWLGVVSSLGLARKTRRVVLVLSLLAATAAFSNRDLAADVLRTAGTFLRYKLASGLVAEKDAGRVAYFYGVAEIVRSHPVFGVGYSGFYAAFLATRAGRANLTEESREAGERGESNPHSAFLYYASANGLPGLVVTLALFVSMVAVLRRALRPLGLSGRLLWFTMSAAFLVNGLTLPTLFNTQIMYLPAAAACGALNRKQLAATIARHRETAVRTHERRAGGHTTRTREPDANRLADRGMSTIPGLDGPPRND